MPSPVCDGANADGNGEDYVFGKHSLLVLGEQL